MREHKAMIRVEIDSEETAEELQQRLKGIMEQEGAKKYVIMVGGCAPVKKE